MQSGRIGPVIRQFFGGQVQPKKPADSHSEQRNQQEQPEREPSREEAMAALAFLQGQEEFLSQGLQAELSFTEGRFLIQVKDKHGIKVKAIRGNEILRILSSTCAQARNSHSLGRILDKRI